MFNNYKIISDYHLMTVLFSLLLTLQVAGQEDSKKQKNYNSTKNQWLKEAHYTFNINDNQEVFFEDQRIQFWDQVGSKILEKQRPPHNYYVNHIIIYAHGSVPYFLIERLKEEITFVWSGFIHYSLMDDKQDIPISIFCSGSSKQKPNERSVHWVHNSKRIYTKRELSGEDSILDNSDYWPVPAFWQTNMSQDFFNLRKKMIEGELEQISYKGITILSSKTYELSGKVYLFTDIELIENLTKNNDLLFIKPVMDLSFEAYYKALSNFSAKRYSQPNSIHGILLKPFIIEVPYGFNESLVEQGINIFN